MTKILNRLGDRLLAVFLPRAEAGAACFPRTECGCYKFSCACVGTDLMRCDWRIKETDCYDRCSLWGVTCDTTYHTNTNC